MGEKLSRTISYAYPSPAGGAQLMSPNSNAPFGHPMRQFHQPGLPQPAGTIPAQMQMHNHLGQNGQMVPNVPIMMSTGQTMPMTSTTQMMTQRPPSESGPPAQSPMAGVPARPPLQIFRPLSDMFSPRNTVPFSSEI